MAAFNGVFEDKTLSFHQKFLLNIIKSSKVPRHIAFIMDGNRRWAKNNKVGKSEAYSRGSDKIGEILSWCLALEMKEITVYAYSLENFKRSQEEVDITLGLAYEKFKYLSEETEALKNYGVCVRVLGNLSYLSSKLLKVMIAVMEATKDNNKFVLNFAIAYTSRDDISNSMKMIVEGLESGALDQEDVDEKLISDCLYTHKSLDPEILIRTSGEVRLSDFYLWQIADGGLIHFVEGVLWPEFAFRHFLYAILQYQNKGRDLDDYRESVNKRQSQRSEKVKKFLEQAHERKWQTWKNLVGE